MATLFGLSFAEVVLLVPGLTLLLVFYRRWGGITSMMRAAGSALFGLYWLAMAPVFFDRDKDVVNAALALAGAGLYLFVAFQVYLDHRWGEETRSLEWLLRVSALTGSFYLVTEHIPAVQGGLIYIVAHLTYLTMRVAGFDVFIQSGFPSGIGEGLEISSGDPFDENVRIVFACTAALAMFLFASAIVATRADRSEWVPWARKELERTKGSGSLWTRSKRWGILNILRMSDLRRKTTVLLIVVPLIFVVNIFRNVGVILAVHGDLMDFYTAHNVVAKALSLLMMMFLTWVLFEYLPELQENMVGLFDLRLRFRKGMIKNGRVDLKYVTPSKKGQDQ